MDRTPVFHPRVKLRFSCFSRLFLDFSRLSHWWKGLAGCLKPLAGRLAGHVGDECDDDEDPLWGRS